MVIGETRFTETGKGAIGVERGKGFGSFSKNCRISAGYWFKVCRLASATVHA